MELINWPGAAPIGRVQLPLLAPYQLTPCAWLSPAELPVVQTPISRPALLEFNLFIGINYHKSIIFNFQAILINSNNWCFD